MPTGPPSVGADATRELTHPAYWLVFGLKGQVTAVARVTAWPTRRWRSHPV